jgi:hypothetical protein
VSIFAPQNVMGPAHRGNMVQQLAQNAAQNVMRRQKLKALLQNATGQGHAVGGGQPFRSSVMGHTTGVRGATFRPGQAAPFGSPGGASFLSAGGTMPVANYPDAGPQDLPSLPSNDPAQSPSSTQPGPTTSGLGPDGTYIGDAAYSAQFPQDNPDSGGAADSPALPGNGQLIPLGNGTFYDPATDTITTGGGVRPGLQQ